MPDLYLALAVIVISTLKIFLISAVIVKPFERSFDTVTLVVIPVIYPEASVACSSVVVGRNRILESSRRVYNRHRAEAHRHQLRKPARLRLRRHQIEVCPRVHNICKVRAEAQIHAHLLSEPLLKPLPMQHARRFSLRTAITISDRKNNASQHIMFLSSAKAATA